LLRWRQLLIQKPFFFNAQSDTVKKWVTIHEEKEEKEVLGRYELFTDDTMNEAYTNLFGPLWNIAIDSREETQFPNNNRHSIIMKTSGRGEGGILIAKGDPLQKGSEFDVRESNLWMIAMPLGVTLFHNLGGGSDNSFTPYFGYGIDFFLGFERISDCVSKLDGVTEKEYEWVDTCYRHSFAGHILIGARWKRSKRYSMLCELRWTQGGKGRLKRRSLSPEEIEEGWGDVFAAFQHPDFNFTGVSFDVGVRWW